MLNSPILQLSLIYTLLISNLYDFILTQAVCCSDHIHCCPSGYTCDVEKGTCDQGLKSQPWLTKLPAESIEVKSVPCPGGQVACPDGSTCCQTASGSWGCCPFPKVRKFVLFLNRYQKCMVILYIFQIFKY